MIKKPTYDYYYQATKNLTLPFAFVDNDLLAENSQEIVSRAKNKKIRIASKSIRSIEILKQIFASSDQYEGLMCFTVAEAVFLSQQGFDDLLLGYPCMQKNLIREAALEIQKGKKIIFMIDLPEHIQLIEKVGKELNVKIPVCIDIDMSSNYPGLRFGVYRSTIDSVEKAAKLYKEIRVLNYVYLDGIMGYEAQIAGVGDAVSGQGAKNSVIKFLKKLSIQEIAKRRENIVKKLTEMGANLRFVNGGGTGSMESTRQESVVTEIAVGSGFYCSGLFDNYTQFKHSPSAGYAIEIVRKPKENMITCHGGGYVASGSVGIEKQPIPYLPEGLKLLQNEGTGEVQTPMIYNGNMKLKLGMPVFMRHSKAGELCERFNELNLISNGQVVGKALTYRGEGKCFL